MKHLRVLAVVLFFGILPALMVSEGLELYLKYVERERIREALDLMSAMLKVARDEINNDGPLRRIVQEIRTALGEKYDLHVGVVDELSGELEKKYPGLVKLFVLDARQRLINNRYSRLRKGVEALARGFIKAVIYGESFDEEWDNLEEMQKVIGKQASPPALARGRSGFKSIETFGRKSTIYWEPLISIKYIPLGRLSRLEDRFNRNTRFPMFIAIFDNELTERYFSVKKVLKEVEKNRGNGRVVLEVLDLNSPDVLKKRGWQDGGQQKIDEAVIRTGGTAVTENALYVFEPQRVRSKTVLMAKTERTTLFPDMYLYLGLGRVISSIYGITFLIIALLHSYGGWRLSIPLRVQFSALFILASALPVGSLFYLGFSFVDEKRQVLEAQVFDQIKNKVMSVSERAASYRDEILEFMREMRDSEPFRNLDTAEIAEYVRKASLKFSSLREFYLFNRAGKIIYEANVAPSYPARGFVASLAKKMMNDMDPGTVEDSNVELMPLVLETISEFGETGRSLFKNPDGLTDVNLGRSKGLIFLSPVRSRSGQVKGAIFCVFGKWEIAKDVLKDMVAQSESKSGGDIVLRGGIIEVEAGRFQKIFNKYPSNEAFSEELTELFNRIADSGQPTSAIIKARLPLQDSETKCLAMGAIAPGLDDNVLIGIVPYERVEKLINRYKKIFMAIALFTILLAISLGVIISWKFIRPFIELSRAVEAMERGELSHRMSIEADDEFGRLSATFNRMIGGLEERERLSRYVSEFVRSEVRKERGPISGATGENMKATILFADIEGFENIVAENHPEDVIALLDEFMRRMSKTVASCGGIIDKFIGESLMAVFYPDFPPQARNDEARAVAASLMMKDELERWNFKRRQAGLKELSMRIGINTGDVIKGNIGARDERMDLTVIGDNVNLAARLKMLAPPASDYRIVLSERTFLATKDYIVTEKMEIRRVKGKTREVEIYRIVGLRHLEVFESILSSPDEEEKILAIHFISVLKCERSEKLLIELLSDSSKRVRQEAAAMLRNFAETESRIIDIFLKVLEYEEDDALRAALVHDIGRLGNDSQRIKLDKFLSDPNPRVRANVIEALSMLSDTAALKERLLPFIYDSNNRVRANTCVKLASLGVEEAVESLFEMISHSDSLMRASGTWAIGELAARERVTEMLLRKGDEGRFTPDRLLALIDRALPELYRLLEDDDAMVVRNAIRSLRRIGDNRAVERLVRKYNSTTDLELRAMILDAMDEIGSYHFIRILRERV